MSDTGPEPNTAEHLAAPGATAVTTPPKSAAVPPRNLEQVRLLFDYTKFHIGLYTTLATLLLGIAGSGFAKSWEIEPQFVSLAIGAIILAGWAGGVVAASLPYHVGDDDIYDKPTGPLFFDGVKIRYWTYLEHLSFWAAIAFIVIAFWHPIRYGPPQQPVAGAPCSVTIKGCAGVAVEK